MDVYLGKEKGKRDLGSGVITYRSWTDLMPQLTAELKLSSKEEIGAILVVDHGITFRIDRK